MPSASYKLIIVGLIIQSGIFAQPHPSIHQDQSAYYKQHYIKPEYPADPQPILPKAQQLTTPSRTVFGYHPYWMGTAWQNYNYSLLTTVAFFSAEATATGQLSDLNGWPVAGLINLAHSNGVDVVLCVTLFDDTDLTTLLSNSSYRQNLINNLITQVQAGNADGVNIDFESFPSAQKNNMVQFITDLTNTFHTQIPGSQVTLATPSVDWSNGWDYNALATISDGLFIMGYGYHWSGSLTTGAISPLTGGTYNITWTVNDYLTKTNNQAAKIILGLPYYGREWPAVSANPGATTTGLGAVRLYDAAEVLAQSYGRIWYSGSQTPYYTYQDPGWYQGWYDDSLSLALKYDFALQNNLQGVGIWALGYDGSSPKLWQALTDKFGAASPPLEPGNFSITNTGNGSVIINFNGANTADSYTVLRGYLSSAQIDTIGIFTQRPILISNLDTSQTYFLKIVAGNQFGISPATEILAVKPSNAPSIALIVNGFDRTSGTNNTRNFSRQHGAALWHNEVSFDGVSNEAVIEGSINLNDYDIVDWILGEESAANTTFTIEEQILIQTYLEQGGHLMISGSEIGYDLVGQGNTADQQFYSNYLKAEYISDAAAGQSGVYQAYGVNSTIFDGISSIDFDNGTHGTYNVDWPDGILPTGGAQICAKYVNVDYNARGGAGIVYNGQFGTGATSGALVYLAIGFEAIYPEAQRNELMSRIVNYFDQAGNGTTDHPVQPLDYGITSIFPNPSNSSVTIEFSFTKNPTAPVELSLIDLLGRTIDSFTLTTDQLASSRIIWNGYLANGAIAPSGVYIALLKYDNKSSNRKFTLLK